MIGLYSHDLDCVYGKDFRFADVMKVPNQIFLVNKIEFANAWECSLIIEYMLNLEKLPVGVPEL